MFNHNTIKQKYFSFFLEATSNLSGLVNVGETDPCCLTASQFTSPMSGSPTQHKHFLIRKFHFLDVFAIPAMNSLPTAAIALTLTSVGVVLVRLVHTHLFLFFPCLFLTI